jgi:hypothetical protein
MFSTLLNLMRHIRDKRDSGRHYVQFALRESPGPTEVSIAHRPLRRMNKVEQKRKVSVASSLLAEDAPG